VAGGGAGTRRYRVALTAAAVGAQWFRYDSERDVLILSLYVQPNARKTEFGGLRDGSLRIRVAAPPIDDKANALLIDFLKKTFDLSGDRVIIRRGIRGRSKTVQIANPGAALLARMEQPL
jgi:uncharacterized protein (TIGR00251 family)